ncbi:hypothetical protein Tco_0868063, partial [Tanacetum coccineum]
CEFDWEFDEVEEYTNNLIAEEELSEDQKDAFMEFLKENVQERKRANREARQKRKQALEELSQEKLDAINNTRFYKFYPLEAPDNTVMPKTSYINRLLRENARQLFLDDIYRNPVPLQFDGPEADSRVLSLYVEDLDYMGRIKKLNEYLEKVRAMVKPGCSQDVVKAALSAMSSVTDILSVMSSPSNSTT